MAMSKEWDDGFSAGVLHALAILNLHGDCGGTQYEEILNGAQAGKIIAYARKQKAMRWAGLDHYLRLTRATPEGASHG